MRLRAILIVLLVVLIAIVVGLYWADRETDVTAKLAAHDNETNTPFNQDTADASRPK